MSLLLVGEIIREDPRPPNKTKQMQESETKRQDNMASRNLHKIKGKNTTNTKMTKIQTNKIATNSSLTSSY